jgi:hypothetical protein
VQFEFVILEWSAYADGLTQQGDWLAWSQQAPQMPSAVVGTVPALAEMPAMMRRRVDRLGRLACQVAYWCQPPAEGAPMVFASRHGDATRSLSLLGDLVNQQPLSPTSFGLSVHNAVSALYSIAQGHTHNTVVVAAGRATVAAALTEAAALLADGANEVLVVYYEASLPGDYAVFQDELACEYAWAWRVAKPGAAESEGAPGVTVRVAVGEGTAAVEAATAQAWPAGLAVLRHVLQQVAGGGVPSDALSDLVRHDRAATQWTWSAHV